MKKWGLIICILIFSATAEAHGRGSWRGGFRPQFGGFALGYSLGYGLGYAPYWGYDRYGYYGYSYPPAVITVPATPPVYVQRNITTPLEPNYWYYCRSASGYYPDVRECPGGWEKVPPRSE